MEWFLFSLISVFFYSCTHLIDSHLVHYRFKHTESVAFCSAFLNLLWIFPLLATGFVSFGSAELMLPFICIGICELGYLYPYFRAQRYADSSVVSSLFIFKRFFVPVLAYVFLSEKLHAFQYIGLGLILATSVISQSSLLKFRIPLHVLLLMAWASLLLSIQDILLKISTNHLHWITVSFWSIIVSFVGNLLLLINKSFRAKIQSDISKFSGAFKLIFVNEVCATLALLCSLYALSLDYLTLTSSVACFTGCVTLLLSWLLRPLYPDAWKENHDADQVYFKLILFLIMACGGVLLIKPF